MSRIRTVSWTLVKIRSTLSNENRESDSQLRLTFPRCISYCGSYTPDQDHNTAQCTVPSRGRLPLSACFCTAGNVVFFASYQSIMKNPYGFRGMFM
jgi:hypothetical protein